MQVKPYHRAQTMRLVISNNICQSLLSLDWGTSEEPNSDDDSGYSDVMRHHILYCTQRTLVQHSTD